MKGSLERLQAYAKAHWKELTALGLAAIPAAFLLFHKGTQQAAANAITYIPAAFGGGGDGSTSSPAPTPPTPVGPDSGSCPPGYHWVAASGPINPLMKIASVPGHCEPDIPTASPFKNKPGTTTITRVGWSLNGANPTSVPTPVTGTPVRWVR